MIVARYAAMGRDGGGFLDEDADIAVAVRLGVDPFVVDHVWPGELRERVLAWMAAEARRHKREQRRSKAAAQR